MSLKECYERVDFSTLVQHLSIDRRLYGHVISQDIDDNANKQLGNLIGVLSGRIGYKNIFDKYILNKNILDAFLIYNDIDGDKKKYLEKVNKLYLELKKETNKRLSRITEKISEYNKKANNATEDDSLNDFNERYSEIKELEIGKPLNLINLKNCMKAHQKLKELDELVLIYDFVIEEKQKEEFIINLNLYDNIQDKLKKYIISNYNQLDNSIKECFNILPTLVLSGQTELLKQIEGIADSNEFNELKNLYLPIDKPIRSDKKIAKQYIDINKKAEELTVESLRTTTQKYLQEVEPFNITNSDDIIAHLEKNIPLSKTFHESSLLYLRGAKSLPSKEISRINQFQSKGFFELAEHLFKQKNFSHSFEIYLDSYSIAIQGSLFDKIAVEQINKSIIGFVISDWAPRLKDYEVNAFENTENLSKNPSKFLYQLVESKNLDIIFHCFDQLKNKPEISHFLNFLLENSPNLDWKTIFIERSLQPRIFLNEPNKGIMQIKSILVDETEGTNIGELINDFNTVCNSYSMDERISYGEITKIKKLNSDLMEESKSSETKYAIIIHERIELIINAIDNKLPKSDEFRFHCRPVNTTYYLDEKQYDLELILNLTAMEDSLPFTFLTIQARVESKYNDFIQFDNLKIQVGPVEPGNKKEIVFYFNASQQILEKYSSVTIEFIFYEGIKIIEPIERKRKFEINIVDKRRGTKSNPYIAGPAIELGGLYVGRDKEINSIKTTLIGQSQDNIPLVLGIRRIGKTSLIKRIAADKDLKRKYDILVYDLQDMPESETTTIFFKKLCSKIYELIKYRISLSFSRKDFDIDPIDAFEGFTAEIDKKNNGKRILIIFDEFEKLVSNLSKWHKLQEENEKFLRPHEALLPEVLGALRKCMIHVSSISFIITGLPLIKESFKEYESRWFGLMTPIEIRPLNEQESKELILPTYLPYNVSNDAIKEIIFMSGMQPYLLQLICRNIFNEIMTSGREMVTKTDVENIIERDLLPNEGYFADYYRLMGEDEYLLHALAICHRKIGSKRKFISEIELHDSLKRLGKEISENDLSKKLVQMTKAERPLIQRNPAKSGSYRIIIGMIGKLLEEKI